MPLVRAHHDVPPPQVAVVDAGQVEGRAVTGTDAVPAGVETLDCPHPDPAAPGPDDQFVADGQPPSREGAGDDRAGARRHERAIHPEPWPPGVGGGWGVGQQAVQGGGEGLHAGS